MAARDRALRIARARAELAELAAQNPDAFRRTAGEWVSLLEPVIGDDAQMTLAEIPSDLESPDATIKPAEKAKRPSAATDERPLPRPSKGHRSECDGSEA